MSKQQGGKSQRSVVAGGDRAETPPRAKAGERRLTTGSRPNILFFFPDQHRFDWLGTNPQLPVRTPNLDALGSRGVRLANALSPSTVCASSRACLASGKEYKRCGVPSNHHDYPPEQPTFYSLLREGGYWVAGCGKSDLHKATSDWGGDGKRFIKELGFSDGIDSEGKWDAVESGEVEPKGPYMTYLHGRGLASIYVADMKKRLESGNKYQATWPSPLPDDAYCDNWIARHGLDLMRRSPKGKPWFLMVNFAGPHDPMDVPAEMADAWREVKFPPPVGSNGFPQAVHDAIRRNYSAMIENIDRWLGVYLNELEKRGERANTVVIYSSDHGEMLGDHGCWGKRVPYQPAVAVPLIIAGPGVKENLVCDAPVSVMDLAATFVDYGGILRPDDMDSRSLRPLIEGRTNHHRDWVSSAKRRWRLIYDGRYKLVGFRPTDPIKARSKRKSTHLSTDELLPLLFDMRTDPLENAPLIGAVSPENLDKTQ